MLSKSWVNHAQVVVVAQGMSCDGKAAYSPLIYARP